MTTVLREREREREDPFLKSLLDRCTCLIILYVESWDKTKPFSEIFTCTYSHIHTYIYIYGNIYMHFVYVDVCVRVITSALLTRRQWRRWLQVMMPSQPKGFSVWPLVQLLKKIANPHARVTGLSMLSMIGPTCADSVFISQMQWFGSVSASL